MSHQLTRWERPHFRTAPTLRHYSDPAVAHARGLVTTKDVEAMCAAADAISAKAQAQMDARVKFRPRKK